MLLTAPAGIAGGLGLVCVGWSIAHAHARRLDGTWVERAASWGLGGGPPAVALGAASSLVPLGGVHSRTAVGLVESGQLRLGPGLLFGLGACAAEAVTVAALALGTARPAVFQLAAIVLGIAALLALALRNRGAGSATAHLVAGWAVIVAGAHLLQHGFTASETPILGGIGGGDFWVRGFTLLALGAALTAALDNGTVVAALAIGAATGGALEPTGAAALLVGVRVGTGMAVVPRLKRSGGDARRASLGILVTSVAQGLVGLLLVAILLPVLMHRGEAPLGPALTLIGFELAFVATAIVMALPFQVALVAGLEEKIDEVEAKQPLEVEFGSLARLAMQDRAVRLRRIARNLAQGVLAERAVTEFRVGADLAETRSLVSDTESLSRGLLGSALGTRTTADLRAATYLEDLPALIEELTALGGESDDALRDAHPALSARMREAELSSLQLVQLALGEATTVNASDELGRQAMDVGERLAEVERLCLSSLGLDRELALATIWRAGRIRWVVQIALGASRVGAPPLAEELEPVAA